MRRILCMIGVVAIPNIALADASDIVFANNQIGLQRVSTNVDYTETGITNSGTWGTLDTESGYVPGYGLIFSSMTSPRAGGRLHPYFAVQYDRESGHTNYVGAYIGGGAYGSVVSTSDASLTNLSSRAGLGIELGQKFMITPYLEYGAHKWDRYPGYQETYTNNWYGVGALGQYSPVSRLVLSANLLLGQTLNSHINVPIASISASLGNSAYDRFGLSADYAFMRHFHGSISYEYTSFKYGESAPNSLGNYEPDSTTHYQTVRVGVGFAF